MPLLIPGNSACCNLQGGYPGHTQDFCKELYITRETIFQIIANIGYSEYEGAWAYGYDKLQEIYSNPSDRNGLDNLTRTIFSNMIKEGLNINYSEQNKIIDEAGNLSYVAGVCITLFNLSEKVSSILQIADGMLLTLTFYNDYRDERFVETLINGDYNIYIQKRLTTYDKNDAVPGLIMNSTTYEECFSLHIGPWLELSHLGLF